MRFLVTGATGFLGWRTAALLEADGHEVVRVARPGGAPRALASEETLVRTDAGDPAVRNLMSGCDAVLHFAGIPDPRRARDDPARAVRENVGATLNLLVGCHAHDAGLVYPSTVRAGLAPPPDEYAISKRLGEETCRMHPARTTTLRLASVYGPGQVAWEGATGAIASFAAAALDGDPLVIPGNPERARDFVYVDDLTPVLERIVADGRWNETVTLASGVATPLLRAAELVRATVGTDTPIRTPGGNLAPGENESYAVEQPSAGLGFEPRTLAEGIALYVDWLRRHPAAQGRPRA
ncbi:MAG: NAD-dependent epimerase/dehydratase family protein [Thermoleophilia bacterium]|nr:NAD-dependent epimerase/dehydratase family protein [Thermoleophilia bacterium]